MKEIKQIAYPNTIASNEQSFFTVGSNCDRIEEVFKSGEMASITWFAVIKSENVIAEIKESVCDIYYKSV